VAEFTRSAPEVMTRSAEVSGLADVAHSTDGTHSADPAVAEKVGAVGECSVLRVLQIPNQRTAMCNSYTVYQKRGPPSWI